MAESRDRSARIVFKWMGFVCAIWVQSIAGNNYTFSNYSADLKHVMGYTQVELNTLGIAKDWGKSVGVLAGLLSEFLPPQIILLVGALVGFAGYGATWLVITDHIAPPSLWQMWIIMFLGGNSSTWMNTACLTTSLRNFPQSRGPVTGILKGFVGLSTAIFTVLCSTLFQSSSSAFLLLLAFVPLVTCLISSIFLREVPISTGAGEDREEQTSITALNVSAIAIALYLLSYTLIAESLSPLMKQCVAWVLLVLLLSPIAVPAKLLASNWLMLQKRSKKGVAFHGPSKEPLLRKVVAAAEENESKLLLDQRKEMETRRGSGKELGENYSLWEALVSLDFWLLFVGFLTGTGAANATINNIAQIGGSLGYVDVTMFVSLISIFGFFGRILSGGLSEYFFRSRGIPRTAWIAASKILMVLAFLVLAFPAAGALHLGSIILGISFGFHVTILVPASSEMFGLKSFGVNYNVLNFSMSLGSVIFSALAGYIYDYESLQPRNPAAAAAPLGSRSSSGSSRPSVWGDLESMRFVAASSETVCFGSHCFRSVFLIMCFMLVIGFVLDIILTLRLRPLYAKLAGYELAQEADNDTEALCQNQS